jgi:DNA-directed RNA polymerase III subunit RPC1
MDVEVHHDPNDKQYVSQDAPKRIKQIQFQPFAPKDIVRVSEVEVTIPELYKNHEDGSRTTAPGGPLDARMVRTRGVLTELLSARELC